MTAAPLRRDGCTWPGWSGAEADRAAAAALDTFAVAAALGVAGLWPSRRLRASLVLAGFEAGMPLVGVGAGQALGHAVGSLA